MNQFRTIKALIVLLAVMIVLTGVTITQTIPALNIGVNSPVVSAANVAWQRSYGGVGDDRAFYALPVGSGFLVVGSTRSLGNTTEGWALMLDASGNVIWNRTYLEGTGTELRYAVNLTDGYLLVGNQLLANDVNGYIAKVDFEGKIVWQNIVGGANIDKLFSGVSASGGYLIFGLTFPSGNSGKSAGWIVKLDQEGTTLWSRTYAEDTDTALRAAVNAPDGGYVTAGYCDPTGNGKYDFYLLKIAPDGSQTWNHTIGVADTQKAYSMTNAPGGYVLAGESHSPQTDADACVVKVDFNGNLVWNKTVGGSEADSASYVCPGCDGGYLVCGFSFSYGAGNRDFWMFKISDAGRVLFSCTAGDAGFQEAYAVLDEGGNQYIMAGWTDPAGHPELIGKATYDWWIVKLSPIDISNSALSNPLVITTFAITFAVLAATLLLLLKMCKIKNK
jgi:hypothetical protein